MREVKPSRRVCKDDQPALMQIPHSLYSLVQAVLDDVDSESDMAEGDVLCTAVRSIDSEKVFPHPVRAECSSGGLLGRGKQTSDQVVCAEVLLLVAAQTQQLRPRDLAPLSRPIGSSESGRWKPTAALPREQSQ